MSGADPASWKLRYRALIDEQDQRESGFRQARQALQRVLLRALSALTADLEVDRDAGIALRRRVERSADSDDPQLDRDVIEYATCVVDALAREPRSDDPNANAASALETARSLLAEFLSAFEAPTAHAERLDGFRAQLARASSPEEIGSCLAECARWISDMLGEAWSELDETADCLKAIDACLDAFSALAERQGAALNDRANRDARLSAGLGEQLDQLAAHVRDDSLKHPDDDAAGGLRTLVRHVCERMTATLEQWTRTNAAAAEHHRRQIDAVTSQLEHVHKEAAALRTAVDRAEQRRRTDVLTGLPNRAALEERLGAELARVRSGNSTSAILVIDIDRFKQINDTHGHLAGDAVLTALGRVITSRLRASDFAGRFGGEEFVVLLSGADASDAALAAEGYRRAIARTPFPLRDGPALEVTVSIGVTAFEPDDTRDTAFERADRALYRAKQNGRNRFIVG